MKRKLNILYISLFLLALIPQGKVSGQQVSGFVYENDVNGKKVALPGVNVFWKGTTKGTFTDESGKFRLSKQGIKSTSLILSLMGYSTDTIEVSSGKQKLEIAMSTGTRDLNEVQITGRKDNTFISKLNTRQTTVITTGELQRAACCNLAESFETNASVDVSYSDAVSGARQIQLLGLSGIYSQVMTENIPLLRGLATTYGLNYIPGSWMELIQIAKGTSSVVQGYESITGQINVEYKKPESGDKFFLNLFGNSNARLEGNADASHKFNDRLSTSLLVHGADFRQKIDRNDDGFLDAPKLTTITAMNRWDYIIAGKWVSRFGIKYLYEDRNGGQMDFEKSDLTFDTNGISTDQKLYGIGVKTNRLEAFWKNGLMFHGASQSSIGLILSGINHLQDGFYGINKYHGHEQNLNANLIYTAILAGEKHKLSAGASYMLDDYSENYQQTQLTYRYQILHDSIEPTDNDKFTLVNDSLLIYNLDRREWSSGIFAEYTFDLKNRFSLIAGLRGDYNSRFGYYFTPRLHVKVNFTPDMVLRGSIGKGYRSPNLLAENSAVFVSQRTLHFADGLGNEEAWNYGLNFTWDLDLFDHKTQFSLDAYRTSFVNHVVVDQDSLPTAVFFYNLNGESYANVIQAQVIFAPVHRLSVTAAFRLNDVRITEGGELKTKSMVNAYKGLLSVSYATKFEKWKFDLTGQFNGPARLPDTEKMPPIPKLRRPDNSPVWFNLLGQVTRKFKSFDIYIGGENLTNFRQMDPIVEYWKPFHTHFDASMAWGPVLGISVYAGLRLTIK
jgi:outer membrane receptor protein involved in Fe transport